MFSKPNLLHPLTFPEFFGVPLLALISVGNNYLLRSPFPYQTELSQSCVIALILVSLVPGTTCSGPSNIWMNDQMNVLFVSKKESKYLKLGKSRIKFMSRFIITCEQCKTCNSKGEQNHVYDGSWITFWCEKYVLVLITFYLNHSNIRLRSLTLGCQLINSVMPSGHWKSISLCERLFVTEEKFVFNGWNTS